MSVCVFSRSVCYVEYIVYNNQISGVNPDSMQIQIPNTSMESM